MVRRVIFIIAIIILTFISSLPVLAYVEELESMSVPTNGVKVFRNMVETGDVLYVFEYQIDFVSDNYSATPASDSILFRLFDTDGSTLLASESPYVYPYFESNGYGLGVSSFYFAAADAPTWASAVKIEIYGTPAYFSPAQTHTYTLTSSDYSSVTTQDDNQDALYDFVLILCDRLAATYADQGLVLKTSSDSGIVLSDVGESYFRGAISGIQALCPALFFFQVYVPERMDSAISYNMSGADPYTARLAADDIGRGFTRLGEVLGVSGQFTAAGVCFLISLFLMFWTTKKGWGVEIGMFCSVIVGTVFALIMGDVLFTILMIISLVAAMGLVFLLLLKRA